jgi:hypothetical protein
MTQLDARCVDESHAWTDVAALRSPVQLWMTNIKASVLSNEAQLLGALLGEGTRPEPGRPPETAYRTVASIRHYLRPSTRRRIRIFLSYSADERSEEIRTLDHYLRGGLSGAGHSYFAIAPAIRYLGWSPSGAPDEDLSGDEVPVGDSREAISSVVNGSLVGSELGWVQTNRNTLRQRFQGEWIAVVEGDVVAHSQSLAALRDECLALELSRPPLIVRMTDEALGRFSAWHR